MFLKTERRRSIEIKHGLGSGPLLLLLRPEPIELLVNISSESGESMVVA